MRRPSALPIWTQVAALAALAVVLSQAVAFATVLLGPDPRPAGFTIRDAALALQGEPAETSDGRALRRRIQANEPRWTDEANPMAAAIRTTLANRLDLESDRVRVSVERPPRRAREMRTLTISSTQRREPPGGGAQPFPTPPQPEATLPGPHRQGESVRVESRVIEHNGAAPIVVPDPGGRPGSITVLADRLTFAPFSAAIELEDGRWATVTPPRGLLSPWQIRVLITLGLSLLLVTPLVWWMARRLTRPIRTFAQAAERLGANPDAEPLPEAGPAEVRTAIGAFNDMQASIRDHMRQRTQTVAAIAHDLRTPLTRLRFRAEQTDPKLRERMAADIEEMDALIGQALAYVRGEAAPERHEPFDLAELARDSVQGFVDTQAAAAIVESTPLPVLGDPAALRRALANLIGNGLKYGGSVRLSAKHDNGHALIQVDDDGPGIPAPELEMVFEPFQRGERSRSRETGGAGLGLTVARQAARAHGGDVTLENRPGGGLTAQLRLPLRVE